jgi:hypothetical protein
MNYRKFPRWGLCFIVFAVAYYGLNLHAAQDPDKNAQKIEALEQKVEGLEKKLEEKPLRRESGDSSDGGETERDDGVFSLVGRSRENLRFGAYGEHKIRYQETPTGTQTGFDAHRVVLLGSYQFVDWMNLNLELEFEHGSTRGIDNGEVEVEQAYIDIHFNEHFNWRLPGIDVVPFGYINQFHEPTGFYSTERPDLYRDLIPSTWFEGSTSLYGKIVDGLNYQFQINSGLEDNANKGSGSLAPGITGTNGVRSARPAVGNFRQVNNHLGYVFRLSYQPSMIPGLAGSSSGYFTVTTPRVPQGSPFLVVGQTQLGMVNTELRYRMPNTGLELRGEYVALILGNHQNLIANNDGNPINNTGSHMWGTSFETAYHFDLKNLTGKNLEFVPFYRLSYLDLQTGGYQGTDANVPTGQGDRMIHTFGGAFFVTPRVVLKLDYSIPMDESIFGPKSQRLQGAVGWFF